LKSTVEHKKPGTVLAIAAHPDDIEFMMAGTLLLLKRAGCETHYLNISSGNCGSLARGAKATRQARAAEARRSAKILGARFHESLADDLEILYELRTLRRLAGIVRQVRPTIVLTHSPQDYMEDHTNTCRLAVTAAFAHGMPNFKTTPARAAYQGDVTVYHCPPHGLRDGLRRRIRSEAYVNTTSAQAAKRAALAEHRSQQSWLEASQGMNSHLMTMEATSRELGTWSEKFEHAEGWRRHLHLGMAAAESDPLGQILGELYLVKPAYARDLEKG
jgi:LmbE family N-acetylglucosaminyl deacetylase